MDDTDKEITSLEQELGRAENEIARLEEQIGVLEDELSEMESHCASQYDEIDQLEYALDEIEGSIEHNAKLFNALLTFYRVSKYGRMGESLTMAQLDVELALDGTGIIL